ncbi:MAG: L-ribulose-5-phosphate 4-epimerase [Pleomorphochaeta sp.]|jgi:L-ribulose-5-phosphate 4-epimerase
MYNEIKEKVLKANLELPKFGLVTFTWGNVSVIDRKNNIIAIKPSGINYEDMSAKDIVILDMDGQIIEGELNPSSDTPTHLIIYKYLLGINSIVHTHSTYATSWAQSKRAIPCYGTTHADYFYGEIPCTRELEPSEIEFEYEKNTGRIILEKFKSIDPIAVPGILVPNHGPFVFGKDSVESVHNAVVLEEVAKMAYISENLNNKIEIAPRDIQKKHYLRKHGKNSYYGQKNK